MWEVLFLLLIIITNSKHDLEKQSSVSSRPSVLYHQTYYFSDAETVGKTK